MGAPNTSAFFSRLGESDQPFQGWLPSGTLAMGVSVAASVDAMEPAAGWEGAGEVPFVFVFVSADALPSSSAAVAPAERELWEKMIGALGFAPARARLGTLTLWNEAHVDGAVAVAVGVSPDEAHAAGVMHVLPSLADLLRDPNLKRPAWKTLQEAAASVSWTVPSQRGSR